MFHPIGEDRRLAALADYGLLGTPAEPAYNQFAAFAAQLFDVPVSAVSLIGADQQWIKGRVGLDLDSTDRATSFCAHTLTSAEPLVVLDARRDPRFADNPAVVGPPHVRFYAGAPLINPDGIHLGALCIIDGAPRAAFGAADRMLLAALADMAESLMEKRRAMRPGKAAGSFAEATGLAIVTAGAQGAITFWNRAAERMFGYPAADAIGRPVSMIIPERFRAEHAAGVKRGEARGEAPFSGKTIEVLACRRDGSEFPIEITIASWMGVSGREVGAHMQDISERRAREAKLRHLAHHDPLTGLLNRSGFHPLLVGALADGAASLLAIDLDAFKSVNDGLGHAVGDALLQTMALRMQSVIGHDCVLARIGGDDFAVLIPGRDDPVAARAVAVSLTQCLAAPFDIDGHHVKVGSSVGVALAPLHALDADELLLRADLALLEAKKAGGDAVRLFSDEMEHELVVRRAFKEEVRQATIAHEWELYYQPQVRLADGALIGVEALLRWCHPVRGLLLPGAFMPVLEAHLVSYEVGCWIIDEACSQLARWRDMGRDVPRMSVNLFASQLRAGTLQTTVAAAIEKHALRPGDLELEITETIALQQSEEVLGGLRDLRACGVHISFDDFGTGFASLSSLKQFPVSRLKIDRSFVGDVCEAPHSAAIVSAVVTMGGALGLEVIAEGIETERQRRRLIELGCHAAQGYLFGRPCRARDLPLFPAVAGAG